MVPKPITDPANGMVVITVYNWDRLSQNQFMGQVMKPQEWALWVGMWGDVDGGEVWMLGRCGCWGGVDVGEV